MSLRKRTPGIATLTAALTLLPPLDASAQPGAEVRVALTWIRADGAESCPDQAEVERDVAERLGRSPFSPSSRSSIRVVVSRINGHWLARIDERSGETLVGSRELPSEAPGCSSIRAAAVLVIALLIDPGAAIAPPRAPASPPVPPLPFAGPRPAARTHPPPPPPSEILPERWPRAPRANMHARGGVGVGLLPRPTFGLALEAGVEGRRIEGSAGMLWLPEAQTDDGAFAFGLTAAWLGACVHAVRFSRGSLSACGALYAGAFHAVVAVARYQPLDPGDRAWAALSLSPLLRISLAGPLSAEIGVDLVAPLTRYRLLAGTTPVFTEPPVGALFFSGLGVSIP